MAHDKNNIENFTLYVNSAQRSMFAILVPLEVELLFVRSAAYPHKRVNERVERES